MHTSQRTERRSARYPLHFLVSVRHADQEIYARSENISLSGILLSTESLIPPGSAVVLQVGVGQIPTPLFLTACGRVLRVQSRASGNFAVAIECDRPFEIMKQQPYHSSSPQPVLGC
jgi:PilZ domain